MTVPPFPARGLYAITDGPRPDLVEIVKQALAGGTRLLQYRDKTSEHARRYAEASALRAICAHHDVPLIINDDIALARATGAAGVHLGDTDDSVALARGVLGAEAIIGVSCYDSAERALKAAREGASYVAFGAFFPSPTKPFARRAGIELLRRSATLGVPRVAIGGITPDNGRSLVEAGADYLAVITAIFASEDVRDAAQRFSHLYSPFE